MNRFSCLGVRNYDVILTKLCLNRQFCGYILGVVVFLTFVLVVEQNKSLT